MFAAYSQERKAVDKTGVFRYNKHNIVGQNALTSHKIMCGEAYEQEKTRIRK